MTPDERRLLNHLLTFLTPDRRARFARVLADRTRWITLVLEDVYQPHNISAVLRSCDAFGVQDVHIVERRMDFELSPKVALGSERWLTLHRHRTPPSEADVEDRNPAIRCLRQLKDQGFQLVAAEPHARAAAPEDLDVSRPIAVILGNEKSGLTAGIAALVDGFVAIPMRGFVESFNVSVAAAICLNALRRNLESADVPWRLSCQEQEELWLAWTRLSIPHIEQIERCFWSERVSVPPLGATGR
jgi:tRNA (guanosine-2'-O-)-methyltransferase